MPHSFSRISRWSITLFVLLALVASTLPMPAARATGIRPIQPAATSTASITRVSPIGSTTWPCGTSWGATCTLQTALTVAVSGDEIWVATGVYTPGLAITATFQLVSGVGVYGGFAMTETLRSQRDPAANVTVLSGDIDGNDLTDPHGVVASTTNITGTNAYHVVTAGSGVTTTAVLDGFTITGGNANGAWPNDGGGGMYTHIGSPTLTNITFSGNSAYSGGGMVNIDSSPTLMNVTFSGNAAHDGGGMYNGQLSVAGSPTLTNVTFSGNSATANGGGMNNYNTNPTLTNVTFSGNSARDAGGGMVNFSGSPTLTNVTFSGNTVQVHGGGLYNGGGSPTLTNVTFNGNAANNSGGGMFIGLSSPTLTNVTFSGNEATYGGGLYAYSNSNPTIRNTILWGNTALTGTQAYNENSAPVISYSVVQGGCPTGSTCTNIITADPRLAALGNYGGSTLTFPLLPGSSAINAGNDTVCPSTDQRGVMRPQSTHCDIGAFEYEYAVGVHYASPTAVGAGDCSSWADACTLQTALTWAIPGDEIWVGAGVHKPTTGSNRTVSFQLKSGVGVYGGFAMTETLRSQRDITANVTVLSGDIDGNDLTDPHGVVTSTINITGTNAYHVVAGSGVTPTAVLDGFTVTGGNANDVSQPNDRGGGMYNYQGSPTLTNVTFSGNSADHGGGMYNYQGNPMLTNVTFSGNTAISWGGGMFNVSSSPTLTNVTFSANTADYGGGMYNYNNSSPTLTNVTFSGNSASSQGGGLYNFDRSSPTLTNVTFSGNSATNSGGGMFNDFSSPTLTNVTFGGNFAPGGGGMYNDYSNPALTNVTFSGNFAQVGGGMYNYNSSSPTIRNTILWGNTASNGAQVYNNISTPAISDSVVQGGCPADSTCANVITTDPRLGALGNYGGATQTFPLLPGSSAIDATSANCPATDQRGVTRPQGSACDIGAFESRGFTLTKTGGDDQSALINTTFALPLQTTLTETGGQPLSGVVITYTAPSSGASASWSGSTTITRTTDSNGNAVAPVLTANGTLGSYAVTANMSGVPLTIFVLHNAKGNTTATINSSANPSLFGNAVTFTVTVASPSGGTPTGTVEFYETISPAASSFDSLRGSGRAQTLASKPLVGGVVTFTASSLAVGTHTLLALYSGDTNYEASTSALYAQGVITYRVYLPLVIRP